MTFLIWDRSFSVNVKRCDDDHRKLLAMVNTLSQAMRAGKGSSVIKNVIQDLGVYAKTHFEAEECLLEQTNYPELEAHRAEHQAFTGRVHEFQQSLEHDGDKSATVLDFMQRPVLDFMQTWLVKHILHSDRSYTAHLNASGIN
jgi:hemerythrin